MRKSCSLTSLAEKSFPWVILRFQVCFLYSQYSLWLSLFHQSCSRAKPSISLLLYWTLFLWDSWLVFAIWFHLPLTRTDILLASGDTVTHNQPPYLGRGGSMSMPHHLLCSALRRFSDFMQLCANELPYHKVQVCPNGNGIYKNSPVGIVGWTGFSVVHQAEAQLLKRRQSRIPVITII